MATQSLPCVTPEQYLEFDRNAEYKHEYFFGEIVAMPGGSFQHNLIAANTTGELRNRLSGGPCRVLNSDMRVAVNTKSGYVYPDVTVVCGAPEFIDGRMDTLTNPKLVANSLAGVHVLFDGVPAPVLYGSAGQVNVVVPYAVAGEAATQVQVEYLGALSPPVSLPVAATAPGIFTQDVSGTGPGAILNTTDESVNSASNPAAPGDWVSIFATGAGATTPPGVDGLLAAGPSYPPNAKVAVTIGGLPCQIEYAGGAPGLVSGVVQINAQVPANVTQGPSVPVQVVIGTASSQSGVTLAVQ